MKTTKKIHADGWVGSTSAAMSGHASPVITWNSVKSDLPRCPKCSRRGRAVQLGGQHRADVEHQASSSG